MGRMEQDVKPPIKIAAALTYLGMIAVNALANILPINGIGTGEVSDSYPNLFAPAGVTFSIWGLIYVLLAGYTLYQLGLFRGDNSRAHSVLLTRIGTLFTVSSLANIAWIFSWHYLLIPLSMLFMIVILACLILINSHTRDADLTRAKAFFVRLPFSVYFGWITVATIANATTLLVDIKWQGFGLSGETWTVLILIVGILIGTATTLRNRDIAYALVFVWAYSGIVLKHVSVQGFAFRYPSVVYTAMACILLILLVLLFVLRGKIREAGLGKR